MHILLIEPDTVLATIYSRGLRAAGHTVSWVTIAQEAVFEADKHSPDVIILELQLVGHNGVEFLHELRSYPDWQAVPVVVHTNVPQTDLSPTLQTGLGVAAYHYKPQTTFQNLLTTLNRLTFAPVLA